MSPSSNVRRDTFFWLGRINMASAAINVDEGLLDAALAPKIAAGIAAVTAAGDAPDGPRPATVIAYEPLLIAAAGAEATLLHAGRSSQDMLATCNAAMLRDQVLTLAERLNATARSLVGLAERHVGTIVPNYTNGVAAQPNSYGHQLLGHFAGLARDAQRLREAFARIDRCPMGTTVLNGTGWPLNRTRMADFLGFSAIVDNAYDAAQISAMDQPVEVGQIIASMALRAGHFVQDTMTQYAQPRPWILLREGEGTTYVSSAMPQKRNPGLLNDTRADASTALTLGLGPSLRAHNIPPGMPDPKRVAENTVMVDGALAVLAGWDRILNALEVDPARALEELNSDWTASQELADVLMRDHGLPFRVGHHFASEVVGHAKKHAIKPADFPFAEARRIYKAAVRDYDADGDLPMTEADFRSALDPVSIVARRATVGGPQAVECARMLEGAKRTLDDQDSWIATRRARIDAALDRLDAAFAGLLPAES